MRLMSSSGLKSFEPQVVHCLNPALKALRLRIRAFWCEDFKGPTNSMFSLTRLSGTQAREEIPKAGTEREGQRQRERERDREIEREIERERERE